MDKLLVKTRICNAITIGGPQSRKQLQAYINGDTWGLNPDIKKTTLLSYINELIKDNRIMRVGHGCKVTYKLYEEPELTIPSWKTIKAVRPSLPKILNDLRSKACVMWGCVK